MKSSSSPSVSAPLQIPKRIVSDSGRIFSCGVRIDKAVCGLGVFSFAFVPKGTPIARVSGKIICDPDYGSDYCISAGDGKVLEPGPPFCYMNHSCEPNCQLLQYVREEDIEEGETLDIGALSSDELDCDCEDEFDADNTNYMCEEEWDEDAECFFGEGSAEEIYDNSEIEIGKKDEQPGGMESVADESSDEEPLFESDVDSEIWVESTRDIMPGEELTIDYSWPADRAVKCLCGSQHCRGWIVDPAERHLIEEI
ncbi:MAG: SET domain-containing protein-lysine N-methyltransferase [Thermoguttaceae bacterium]